jgi:uncharacterized membrane protein YkvA (DUF1232 family)
MTLASGLHPGGRPPKRRRKGSWAARRGGRMTPGCLVCTVTTDLKPGGRSSVTWIEAAARQPTLPFRSTAFKPPGGAPMAGKPQANNKSTSKKPALAKKPSISKKDATEQVKKAQKRADKYKDNPEAAEKLLKDAQAKAKKHKGPITERLDELMTLIRLVRAYFNGQYRDLPWETIALALGAVIYFVSPIDLIPDVIPVAGYIDDAAVIGLVIASLANDLENFREWESTRKAA